MDALRPDTAGSFLQTNRMVHRKPLFVAVAFCLCVTFAVAAVHVSEELEEIDVADSASILMETDSESQAPPSSISACSLSMSTNQQYAWCSGQVTYKISAPQIASKFSFNPLALVTEELHVGLSRVSPPTSGTSAFPLKSGVDIIITSTSSPCRTTVSYTVNDANGIVVAQSSKPYPKKDNLCVAPTQPMSIWINVALVGKTATLTVGSGGTTILTESANAGQPLHQTLAPRSALYLGFCGKPAPGSVTSPDLFSISAASA